jgi:hypothetical protein
MGEGQHPHEEQDGAETRPARTELSVIRASDAERDAVIAQLNQACAEGRLTLEEFSARLEQALAARTRGDLELLTSDLPSGDHVPRPARHRRVMLGVLFDSRLGRPAVENEITAVAVLGDVRIDLSKARVTSNEITIRAYAILKDVEIIVPDGVAVDLSGVAVMGDNANMVPPVPVGASRFVVKIDGHAILGDVEVMRPQQRAVGRSRRRSIEG